MFLDDKTKTQCDQQKLEIQKKKRIIAILLYILSILMLVVQAVFIQLFKSDESGWLGWINMVNILLADLVLFIVCFNNKDENRMNHPNLILLVAIGCRAAVVSFGIT